MEKNLGNILEESGELILDSLIENELLKEIPVIGTSVKIIRAVKSIRDTAYLNKVKTFVEQLGEINDAQRKRLVEESKKDIKRRVKFGNALFTTIEQSESLIKVQYSAIAFEAFLNEDFEESDLRLICHIIRNSFTDELIDIVENDIPKTDLKFVVPSGLAENVYVPLLASGYGNEPEYNLTISAKQLREAWKKYRTK
ncbi:MAG: hypothetical protein QM499_02920 [Flavobacteriaceae bacterium]